eukprot:13070126-Ditylum_brightwellii.AAC.1
MREAAEKRGDALPKLKLTPMFSYFKTTKKKGNSKTMNPSAATVDLTSAEQFKPTLVATVECAGVYNSVNLGNAQDAQRKNVTLYCYYLGTTSAKFFQGLYGGLPSIVSTKCMGKGIFPGNDGGRVCEGCKDLRVAQGFANPSGTIDKWGKTISQCLERREKNVLTMSDLDDAEKFIKTWDNSFSPASLALKEEAK